MNKFSKVIVTAVQEGCSDLHITGGHPVVYRKNGQIQFDNSGRWTHGEIDGLVKKVLTARQLQTLRNRWSVDLAITIRHIRIRVNVFNTTRGLSIAVRLLPGTVPTIEKLNLHPSLKQAAELRSGLVLICGATGSGKSTTIAALVDEINRSRAAHIVTLEDPVEYRYVSRKSFIEQRELGAHMPSFEQGLVDVLREDPDVIVVGELREPEVMRLTLNAAESGHLVIATLHATHAEDALYRLCNSFPVEAQEEIRHQVASTLQWLVVQQLVIREDMGFRVPVLSILRGNQSVKGILRENKLPQIESAIQMGKNDGMFTAERYIREYLAKVSVYASPQDIFKPSAELSQEEVYHSPLVDGEPAGPRPVQNRKAEPARGGSVYGSQANLDFSTGTGYGLQEARNGISAEPFRRQQPVAEPGRGNGEKAAPAPDAGKEGAFDHLYSQSIDDAERGGAPLIIDETASIDELIAQISNFGRPKA
ncbi:MAG: type IV pilus twitching motility protein PilT [Syntrophaceae bacterium]